LLLRHFDTNSTIKEYSLLAKTAEQWKAAKMIDTRGSEANCVGMMEFRTVGLNRNRLHAWYVKQT